jgi:hypothetical protein
VHRRFYQDIEAADTQAAAAAPVSKSETIDPHEGGSLATAAATDAGPSGPLSFLAPAGLWREQGGDHRVGDECPVLVRRPPAADYEQLVQLR